MSAAIPERIIGRHLGELDGPLVVCVGGIHGNEPSGVLALQRVLQQLAAQRSSFRGDLVGLAGNLQALARGQRFVEEDLNRQWATQRIERIRLGAPHAGATIEEAEQRALLEALQGVFARARGDVFFLDLHTSSAEGRPFICIGDTLRNRAFALQFPVPLILGIEEHIDGALLEYVNNLGHVTLGFEAGQHDSPASVEFHEAAIWTALFAAGNLELEEFPEARRLREALARTTDGLPRILEVRYRHQIDAEDRFEMAPGFTSFDAVRAGQVVARDRRGEIRAPESGRLVLPLYQGQGNDGFFLAREVRPFWLGVSDLLRRMRLAALLPWLPGIRRNPIRTDELSIDPRLPRRLVVGLLHLLGYRKHRPAGGRLIVRRRKYDAVAPCRAQSRRYRMQR